MSYKKQELLTLREQMSSPPVFWLGTYCSSFLCSIMCLNTFLVPCSNIRYDFRIKWCIVRLFPPVVCRRDRVLLCFCMFTYSNVQHLVLSHVFTFWVSRCDARDDFRLQTVFGSYLSSVVYRRVHVFKLFVSVCA